MRNKIAISLLLLLSVSFAFALAADDLKDREFTFSWLPAGNYTNVGLLDFQVPDDSKHLQDFREMFPQYNMFKMKSSPVPSFFSGDVEQVAMGMVQSFLYNEEKDAESEQRIMPIVINYQDDNGEAVSRQYDFHMETYIAARIENAFDSIEQAKEKELLEVAGQAEGFDVYLWIGNDKRPNYLCNPEPGIVLLSSSIEGVTEMVQAGLGAGLSLIDEKIFNEFKASGLRGNLLWSYRNTSGRMNFELEESSKYGVAEEEMELLKKRAAQTPLHFIMVVGIEEEIGIVESNIAACRDREAAEKWTAMQLEQRDKALEHLKGDLEPQLQQYKEKFSNAQYFTEENNSIERYVYSEAYLDLRVKARAEREKR
jgi:hypothetical protein